MIAVVLFDAFFVIMGGWAAMRLINTARTGTVVWQRARFSRSDSLAAYLSVTAFNIAMVIGAIYGIVEGGGLQNI